MDISKRPQVIRMRQQFLNMIIYVCVLSVEYYCSQLQCCCPALQILWLARLEPEIFFSSARAFFSSARKHHYSGVERVVTIFLQNLLVFIMDHLSKITSQSQRNKMNPQNLSICFAPVLMLDFSQTVVGNPSAANTTATSATSSEVPNISEPIQILTYLIEIWPKSQE